MKRKVVLRVKSTGKTRLKMPETLLLMFLLIPSLPAWGRQNYFETFQRNLPGRTLKFPIDKWAPAHVYLMGRDVKSGQRIYKQAFRDLGSAKGAVCVPAGGAVGLIITMEGPEKLSSLKHLHPNDVQYIRAHSIPLQSADLKNIEHLKGLEELECEFTDLDDSAIPIISRFNNMETLMLKHCNITDRYLELLSNMPRLKNIFLEYCQVTDDGIKKLAGNPNLVTLSLEGTRVTEGCIPYLLKMKNLEDIRIPAVSLNDDQLMRLASLHSLLRIQIGNRKITRAGIERFNKKLPECSVNLYKFKIPMEMLF